MSGRIARWFAEEKRLREEIKAQTNALIAEVEAMPPEERVEAQRRLVMQMQANALALTTTSQKPNPSTARRWFDLTTLNGGL